MGGLFLQKLYLGIFGVLLIVVMASGCTSTSKQYNNTKYSFNYPDTWNITFDNSNETDGGIDFDGTGLLMGQVESIELNNETPESIMNGFKEWTWSNPKQLNGYKYYEGIKTSESNSDLVYNKGLFIKNNTAYLITVNGDNNTVTDGFNTIRDSFKINN